MKSTARIAIVLIVGVLALGLAANANAQGTSGTLVGDTGGAYATMNVSAPAGASVTLTLNHNPCLLGGAVGLEVWGASGMLASSSEKDACTQTAWFNSGSGGALEVKVYNYMHGTPVHWSLSAEGLDLGGTAAAAEPAAEASTDMAADASTDMAAAPAADTTMAADTAAATTTTTETAAAGASGAASIDTDGSVAGNGGGAYAQHNLSVMEGQMYTVKMTAGTEPGGNWPGIGFDVWGPNGKVATSWASSHNVFEASFTAAGDVVYLIQPYNYHHGVTMWYHLSAGSSAAQ